MNIRTEVDVSGSDRAICGRQGAGDDELSVGDIAVILSSGHGGGLFTFLIVGLVRCFGLFRFRCFQCRGTDLDFIRDPAVTDNHNGLAVIVRIIDADVHSLIGVFGENIELYDSPRLGMVIYAF